MEVLGFQQKNVLKGHVASIAKVVFNSKGEYCVSGSYDKSVRL